jgi:hypothetical protein
MSDPLEDIIQSGKLKIERSRQESIARQERLDAYYLDRTAKRNEMAFDLIPEVLRPFARVEDPDVLVIAVPNCAIIKRRFLTNNLSSQWNEEFGEWISPIERVSFSDTSHAQDHRWRIFTWCKYFGEDGWEALQSLWKEDGTNDLEQALAIAAEVGDNRADIEEEVIFKNSQAKENAPSSAPEQNLICPLMSMLNYAYADCQQAKCAFWDVDRKQCAVLGMALGIASTTAVE